MNAPLARWLPAVLFAGAGLAASIPIANPSFEELTGTDPAHFDAQGKLLPGHYSSWFEPRTALGFSLEAPVPGWTAFDYSGILAPTLGAAPEHLFTQIPDGRQVLYSEDGSEVSQVLAATFQAGNRYTFRLEVGRPANGSFVTTWQVTLGISGRHAVADLGGKLVPLGEFRPLELAYTVLAGDPVVGQPIRLSLTASGSPLYFDNLRLDVEPAAGPRAVIAPAVEVSWASLVSEWYQVERATRLDSPDWKAITGVLRGTGARMVHFDVAGESVSYYRVAPVLGP